MASLKQVWAQILRGVHNRTNKNVVAFLSIKNVVRLETVAALAVAKFVSGAPDAGEICNQLERALKAGNVSVGLIFAELGGGRFFDL